jgi:hypothetical protein
MWKIPPQPALQLPPLQLALLAGQPTVLISGSPEPQLLVLEFHLMHQVRVQTVEPGYCALFHKPVGTPACGTAQFTNCHRTFRSTSCREAVDELEAKNDKMEVGQNIPNPFSDQTSISYFIPEGMGNGQFEVVSIEGKILLSEMVQENVSGEVTILKGRLAPGTYFYRLKTMGTMTRTQKMVVQ